MLVALCSTATLLAMSREVDPFFNPSVTGYYEHRRRRSRSSIESTSSSGRPGTSRTPPGRPRTTGSEQLRSIDSPGDVVRVDELVVMNQTDVFLGDRPVGSPAAHHRRRSRGTHHRGFRGDHRDPQGLINDPLVTVVLEDGRFQFTIYGAVAGTGIYASPADSVMDAIALGMHCVDHEEDPVIREVAIDETVKPGYEREPESTTGGRRRGRAGHRRPDRGPQQRRFDSATPANWRQSVRDVVRRRSPGRRSRERRRSPRTRRRLDTRVPRDTFIRRGTAGGSDCSRGGRSGSVRRPLVARWHRSSWKACPTPPGSSSSISVARQGRRPNIVIRPGDRIYVDTPEVGVVYIDGEIPRPGSTSSRSRDVSLSRLVAAAGGLNQIAIPEGSTSRGRSAAIAGPRSRNFAAS